MQPMKAEPDWLKVGVRGAVQGVGVDRKANAIMGYVVAQAGPFREPDPRGEFDGQSLRQIVQLMQAKDRQKGTKVRFGHPSLSGDAIGSYLGRARNPRLSSVTVERDGKMMELEAVRADLHLAESAGKANPNGDLREYVLTAAEDDPDSLSSSLVLQPQEEWRVDAKGKPLLDREGNQLPPLWRVKVIHASDLTDEGAAVDGLLSAGIDVDRLPDALQRRAWDMLDRLFAGQTAEVVGARCGAFLNRYLEARFGPKEAPAPTPNLDKLRLRLDEMSLTTRKRVS